MPRPLQRSEEPAAVTTTDAEFTHPGDAPVTVGSVGADESSRAVTLLHADVLPAPSIARNRTTVTPSVVTNRLAPSTGDVYGAPFVGVSLWYPANPDPPPSVDPDALSGSEVVFCQPAPALLTSGSVGDVRS